MCTYCLAENNVHGVTETAQCFQHEQQTTCVSTALNTNGCFPTTTEISGGPLKCSTASLRVHPKCDQQSQLRVAKVYRGNFLRLRLSLWLVMAERTDSPRPRDFVRDANRKSIIKKRAKECFFSQHNYYLFIQVGCARRAKCQNISKCMFDMRSTEVCF